jgi:hypothetical protein
MTLNAPPKPKHTQKSLPDEIQGRDLFQTPNYATELLIPFIPKNVTHIWECAAGNCKITNVLKKHGYTVMSTDIKSDIWVNYYNFITDVMKSEIIGDKNWMIITNPPFSLKKKFYDRCYEYNIPFGLLIPADYSAWIINSIRYEKCEKIIPDRRIDFITPTGLSGASGHTAYYHSMWLTSGFGLGKSETFVELTKEMKQNI